MRVRRATTGFTLVEMLLTITLFAMIMSILVVGLRTAVKTWQSVRRHQSALVARDLALDCLARDVRGIAKMDKDLRALTETVKMPTEESLTMTTLGSRTKQRSGQVSVWSQVGYSLRTRDDNGVNQLVRTETPFAAMSPIEGGPRETVLIDDVQGLRFDYLDGKGAISPVWEDASRLPAAVVVTLTQSGSSEIQRVMPLPCGSMTP